jgi:ATP-dependent helicase/nuclease subunit A
VDFKTGTHEGGDRDAFMSSEVARYQPQLTAYARAFAKLEQRPVMLGLYYPRLDAWREWPGPMAVDGD